MGRSKISWRVFYARNEGMRQGDCSYSEAQQGLHSGRLHLHEQKRKTLVYFRPFISNKNITMMTLEVVPFKLTVKNSLVHFSIAKYR